MKSLFITLLTIFSLSSWAQNPIFSYHLEIEVFGDGMSEIYLEDIEDQGWIAEDYDWDEVVYTLGKRDVPFVDKAIQESISDVNFVIRKTRRGAFMACLGVAVGDYDASAEGCTYLRPGVNVLMADGGNHSGGSWSFDGKAVIHWK